MPALAGLLSVGMLQGASAQQPVVPRPGERVRENIEQRRDVRETVRDARDDARDARDDARDGRKFENMDQFMVGWLTPGNEEEIILAKFAQERSKNEQVKQFAAMMIKDHSKFLQELKKFGHVEHTFRETGAILNDREARTADTQANRANENRDHPGVVGETVRDVGDATREVARDVGEVVRDAGDAVRHAVGYTDAADACRIKQEVHRECLTLTERELDKWQGAEFDQAYLGQQAGAHIGMLATLKTFEKHASNEFKPVIQQAIATTEQHLNQANELMQQVGRPATARRTAGDSEAQE
jgi:predicted outer membrane protein